MTHYQRALRYFGTGRGPRVGIAILGDGRTIGIDYNGSPSELLREIEHGATVVGVALLVPFFGGHWSCHLGDVAVSGFASPERAIEVAREKVKRTQSKTKKRKKPKKRSFTGG
jgi:hypothetical protein